MVRYIEDSIAVVCLQGLRYVTREDVTYTATR